MFDLIAFDIDGTLVDSAEEIAATVNDVLQFQGLPGLPTATIRNWIGLGAQAALTEAFTRCASLTESAVHREHAADPRFLDSMMVLFEKFHGERCGTHSRLFPQVNVTLARLRTAGVKLAVVTNKEERLARQVLDAHDLANFFDPIVGGDTLPTRKPDPGPMLHCLEFHGVAAARALMVGDSEFDVRMARAAGVKCWVVPYGAVRPARNKT